MPELPEVESVRIGLAGHVLGRTIEGVCVYRPYSIRHTPGGAEEFQDELMGATFAEVARRGKFLWFILDAPEGTGRALALVVHLGMSGQLRVHSDTESGPGSHTRVRLTLGGASPMILDFVDQRTFGYMTVDELVLTTDGGPGGVGTQLPALPARAAHIARDLTDPLLDLAATAERMKSRRSPVKAVLLDQGMAAGVGNIYADEALWRARINGGTRADRIALPRLIALLEAGREVMTEALAQGGTSFDALYVNVNGESGYFSRSLNVYGRAGDPCPRCGEPIRREAFANRSSHFCPRCQRRK
ncbi:bifunctional DNA-formamidopyrimidine glycosylase/DNA-(apurinic or apyrimidinic site) lyase [Rarobacter faecitabidus]|uniref:Formamidopyrimidine-DNA glycosylase n=1 Tax=Rarobacter faecitabidus TaxID=13243 RepID=A0A542ZV80_RARFA|nr:bifunctional DNA-formamidopyrimidine glycosylase/DNA-(apurinic or apyrimidinic site) lyase [Rarobacter faecitabidus]TQL64090.1 DNA-(apurinic or apyrimidinic site) lyase [Rarobacter faecitabidus]